MPSGRGNSLPPSGLLGRAKVDWRVWLFCRYFSTKENDTLGCGMSHCSRQPAEREGLSSPFQAESTSLWFWLSSQPTHSTQALARTPPTSASFKGNKASHLILKLKSQREQKICRVLATSCSSGHRRWEIRRGLHGTCSEDQWEAS